MSLLCSVKRPISATIDEDLIKWLDATVKRESNYRNKSHLIELALDSFRQLQQMNKKR